MSVTLLLLLLANISFVLSDSCLQCICSQESGCKPLECKKDKGSLSCGYYQIKLAYYKDCGMPGKKNGESVTTAWKRCAGDYDCANKCVQAYYKRYKSLCKSTGQGECEVMARNHNGGPTGCKKSSTAKYWADVKQCLG